jgi:hypothetical protein
MIRVNKHGQIVADDGITWLRDVSGFYSVEPVGYFIELLDHHRWEVFRKTTSSYPEKIPFVRQRLGNGSLNDCMRVAEIYQIRRLV